MSMADDLPSGPPAGFDEETIAPAELAYHRKVVAQFKRMSELRAEIVAADAAFRSWGEHLQAAYGLGPHDGVDEDGRVIRATEV